MILSWVLKFESGQKTNQPESRHEQTVSAIASGAGIIFSGNIINLALRYLFQIFVARHLGVDLYGIFTLGMAVFAVGEMVASLGLHKGIVRFVSLYNGEGDLGRVKGTIFAGIFLSCGGGIVVMLLLMALSGLIAGNIFHTPEMSKALVVFAAGIPFSSLTTVFIFATQGLRIMKFKVFVKDLWEALSRIALAILLFSLGWGLGGAVAAFILSIISGTFLSYYFFQKTFSSIFQSKERAVLEPKVLMAYCWPLVFAGGFNMMEAWVSTFVLGYLADTEAVGIFGAAFRTSMLIQGILMSFNAIFSPIIAEHYHKGELGQLKTLFKMVTKWVFSLSLPPAILLIFYSREVMTIFGQAFSAGALVLTILVVGQIMNSLTGPLGVMIDMSGRSKYTLLNSVLHFTLQIILCFLLIPTYGVLGAAVAKMVSIVFLRAIRLLQVHLIFKFHPFQLRIWKPLSAGFLALLLLLALKSIIPWTDPLFFLLAGSTAFMVAYGTILYLLGFDAEDKLILDRVRAKLVI
jgi:O-antigen/teichoic acid export membrane protein